MIRALYWVSLIELLFVPAVHGQRDLKEIPDPDSEIERRSFQVAEGFEVNLFAADPLLAKPIQMNFDSAGRLWVATSAVYPQIRPGQAANDRILIIEDSAGTGKADKVTVFADGLLIPTGIAPGDGGVYVANSTDLVHIAEDRPGHAGNRKVVLSGFGTEDTHHILHSLRWGPDGRLYFNQSIYIHSHIETPYGVRHLNGGGIWRFCPDSLELEVLAHGFCNPWGHHFDYWGQSFATDGAYGEGINYVVSGASYVFTPGATRILAGLNPGSPKHCGLEILSGRHLPEPWRGNMITNDFRGHRVCRFVVSEDGSSYVSKEMPELIKTSHGAFRPVDVKMGPDGAIYIADWYNPIIQHGEVDFRDPRRDQTHGRIWRITAKGRSLSPPLHLVDADVPTLLEALKAPEEWTRLHAKRVLKSRGRGVLVELQSWLQHLDTNDANYEHNLLEALWTFEHFNEPNAELLRKLLVAKDYHVRAAAVRVLTNWQSTFGDASDLLAHAVADQHPQVRLEAVRTLAHVEQPRAMTIALSALDLPMDKILDYALWLTARELAPHWLPLAEKGSFEFTNSRHLIFALQAAGSPASLKPLIALVHAGKIEPENLESAVALIADLGGPDELRLVFEDILPGGAQAEHPAKLLASLERAARRRHVKPSGNLASLGVLTEAKDEATAAAAYRLAGLWQVEFLRPSLKRIAFDSSIHASSDLRAAAIDGLVSLGGEKSKKSFSEAAAHGTWGARGQAVIALAELDLTDAAKLAAPLLADPECRDPSTVISAFVVHKHGAGSLASQLRGQKLSGEAARAGLSILTGNNKETSELVKVLTEAARMDPAPKVLDPQEMKRLVVEVLEHGDAARGERIYRRKDTACMKCHAIGGAGGQVGPDLASIGASAPIDYLVESILLPNKAIKENYHSWIVVTREGKVYTGIKVRETETDLVLRNVEDREVVIPLNTIEEKGTGGSLMPERLADPLSHGEFVDLVRFLSELGKSLSVGKAPVVRRWEVLTSTHEPQDFRVDGGIDALVKLDSLWLSTHAYSNVSGDLTLSEMPFSPVAETPGSSAKELAFLRCEFETSSAGKVQFNYKGLPQESIAYLDGRKLGTAKSQAIDVFPGRHKLILRVTRAAPQGHLRCEIEDAPGSAAHVRIIGGK
jgi:putative heme-binding domain-containing protein